MKTTPKQIVENNTAQDILHAAMIVLSQLQYDDRVSPKTKSKCESAENKLQIINFEIEEATA
jgi:hypothetical protein